MPVYFPLVNLVLKW